MSTKEMLSNHITEMLLKQFASISNLFNPEMQKMIKDQYKEYVNKEIMPGIIEIIRFDVKDMKQFNCNHEGYSFEKDGRCCPHCGAFMVDFGD